MVLHRAKVWLAACLSVVAFPLAAGELVLKNGDRLAGSLVKLQGGTLVWQSESFGALDVPKANIAQLSLDQQVKLQGQSSPCTLQNVEQGVVNYECEKTGVQQLELLALESILPYEAYADGAGHEYSGKMAIQGVYQSGNTVEEDWDFDVEIGLKRGDFRHKFAFDYESDSSDDQPADESFEVLYRLDWFFSERWFWYNEVSTGADEPKNIDESYVYGTGVGVQLWEFTNTALALESGFDWVNEHYEPTVDDLTDPDFEDSRERAAWRFATNYFIMLPFDARLTHTNELLYSLENSDDWMFEADLGLSLPLGAGLFSEFKIEYDYDNLPSSDEADKDDTKVTVGIGYNW